MGFLSSLLDGSFADKIEGGIQSFESAVEQIDDKLMGVTDKVESAAGVVESKMTTVADRTELIATTVADGTERFVAAAKEQGVSDSQTTTGV